MRYEEIKDRSDKDFKRLTGVEHPTFRLMVSVLEDELPTFGRPPKLNRADQLLMTLMYWREYRTQFHIAQAYGVSEATVCRTIEKVEKAAHAESPGNGQSAQQRNPEHHFWQWQYA